MTTIHTDAIIALWTQSELITRKIDANLGALHGIGFTEYIVLLQLNNAPKQMLRRIDLSEAIGRTASGVTRRLLPMEKIGLIEKASAPRDARVSLVKITASGQQLLQDATVTLNEKSADLLKRVSKGQIKDLLTILHTMTDG